MIEFILPIFIALWVGGAIFMYFDDKKEYNNGICSNCGHRWRYFDTDSQGGRGYICDECKRVIWISWPIGDKGERK